MPNLSIREWVPVETYGGILLASNDEFLSKDFCNRSLSKEISIFLSPTRKFLILSVVSYSWVYRRTLCKISSTNFEAYVKVPTRSRIVMFWIFGTVCKNYSRNSKHHNSWSCMYFDMRFEICRWNLTWDSKSVGEIWQSVRRYTQE